MSRFPAANNATIQTRPEIYEDGQDDSEIEYAYNKTIRDSRLASIAWHKHVHMVNKTLGHSTSETPLSIVPESILSDSEIETPISDFGTPVALEAAGGDGNRSRGAEAKLVKSMLWEDDGVTEMPPHIEPMMRILLPRYFDLVRSFL